MKQPDGREDMLWRCRPRGGYSSDQGGFDLIIPVTVIRRGKVRVQIEVPLRRGGTVIRWVMPASLYPRNQRSRS